MIVLGVFLFWGGGGGYGRLLLVRFEKGNRRVMEILRVLLEGEGLIILGRGGVMIGYSL